MKITKNDVGRFAITRSGNIIKIESFDNTLCYEAFGNDTFYGKNGQISKQYKCDEDLIQWADEHPKYKAVFTWPEKVE